MRRRLPLHRRVALSVAITVQDNGAGQPEQSGFLPMQSGHITVTPAH